MRTDIISKAADGTIQRPEQLDFIMKQPYIRHEVPTSDPGFYHRHIMTGATYWDASQAIDRFADQMRDVPGYKLIAKFEKHVPGAGAHTHSLEVLYAIDGDYPAGTQGNRMVGAMLYPYQ